jgi:hypothetical protein
MIFIKVSVYERPTPLYLPNLLRVFVIMDYIPDGPTLYKRCPASMMPIMAQDTVCMQWHEEAVKSGGPGFFHQPLFFFP